LVGKREATDVRSKSELRVRFCSEQLQWRLAESGVPKADSLFSRHHIQHAAVMAARHFKAGFCALD
jgi:hypothetical protein